MQRDFDLVVTILGALRDSKATTLSTLDIKQAVLANNPGDQGIELVAHHLEILGDAGLVKQVGAAGDKPENTEWRITWKGYDALEQDEEDEDDEDYEES